MKAYSAAPANEAELRACLEKYVSDPQVRQRVLKAARAGLAVRQEHLVNERAASTQPRVLRKDEARDQNLP